MTDEQRWAFATQQVHSGHASEPSVNPRATPIYLTAGYVFGSFDEAAARFAGDDTGYVYSRQGNPTVAQVERRLAALEGGAEAILVASGQAAVTSTLLGVAGAGDHILASSSLYGGTRGLLIEDLPRFGLSASFVARPSDPAAWEMAIQPNTKALFLESIPNARNDLVDIAGIAEVAHRAGLPLIVDNTFATPALLRPIEHGADIVVHSTSKFLIGNGTAIGGVVVTGDSFDWGANPDRFRHLNSPAFSLEGHTYVGRFGPTAAFGAYLRTTLVPRLGPSPSPSDAFLLLQGIETLSVRVARQSASALEIARWLAAQDVVESVDYSGLPGNAYHQVALKLLPDGQGSVFTFTLRGGLPVVRVVYDALRVFTRMTHLGDVRSLALHPRSTTHRLLTPEEAAAGGVFDGTLRISIGLESPDDLIADLAQAFAIGQAYIDEPHVGAVAVQEGKA